MNIKSLFYGLFGLAGIFALSGCTQEQESNNEPASALEHVVVEEQGSEEAAPISGKLRVEQLAEDRYHISLRDIGPSFFSFRTSPDGQAGIYADIYAYAMDEGLNAGIAKLIVYEDGHELSSIKNNDLISVSVSNNKPGSHTYEAVAVDNGGVQARSEKIILTFTGKPIDSPPDFCSLFGINVVPYYSGDFISLTITDEGDNKGLKEVLLYDHGTVVRRFEVKGKDYFNEHINLASLGQSPGTHLYHAEAVDIGGNRSTSKTITITYTK